MYLYYRLKISRKMTYFKTCDESKSANLTLQNTTYIYIRTQPYDEYDSPCPFFDTFYEQGGANAIKSMANFNPSHFYFLWNNIEA